MTNAKKTGKSSEELMAPLTALISKGRKDGMIQASELMNELEKLDLSVEKIEQVYESFESMGIQIVSNELDLEVESELDLDLDA